MREQLLELMADILKIPMSKLEEHKDSREVWDSLTRVEIIFAIEEEHNIIFDKEDLAVLVTPSALCNAVLAKVAE